MRAVLVKMKVVKALGGEKELPVMLSAPEKLDILEITYITIILFLLIMVT